VEGEFLIPIIIVPILFIGLPWLILHYVTKWKVNSGLTAEDENMLDDLYDLARRLDERMNTLERIMADDNPGWNALASDRPLERPVPRLEKSGVEELRRRSNNAETAPRGRA
jgi:phage shock protein B